MAKVISPKKLIEVALPLDEINAAAAREKSIRHGHPSTLHLWWARRPLAAARAVIFAQMVNDPSETVQGDKRLRETKLKIVNEREKLFDIIRELVKWENTNNEEVLNKAREAIKESWRFTCELNKKHPQADELFNPEKLPAFHDPFAGGGAIPLEAQRLGLESYASDLNPVAVMINKAMIEIPPKFSGQAPVGPIPAGDKQGKTVEDWSGSKGLAEDVRRYGYWIRERAFNQIGHLYPKVEITNEMIASRPDLKPYENQSLTVIAYIWARTVRSPNPRYSNRHVPLISNFVLSSNKKGPSYIEPVVDEDKLSFEVKIGTPPADAKKGTKAGRGASFTCLLSDTPMSSDYVRSEFKNGRSSTSLLAVVVEGKPGRVYLSATKEIESTAQKCAPDWKPEFPMNQNCKDLVSGRGYGFSAWHQLFTDRQLKALTTFSDLVSAAKNRIVRDLESIGKINDGIPLYKGGTGVLAYAEAVSVYLAFGVDKMADRHSSFVRWDPTPTASGIINTFSRQAIPMSWDFPEGNPFSSASGNFEGGIDWIVKSLQKLPICEKPGHALQVEAQKQVSSALKVVSTDPPYYDNISYADLSDFFYVWLRSSISEIYPDLFGTMAVPKTDELVASSHRHGSALDAEKFFLNGMAEAINNLAVNAHPGFPVSIYYAFKQSETKDTGTASTGWETFLEAVVNSGFSIDGTWPMRTELANRMIASGTNALASSVVLVCRKRSENAVSISRRQFQRELREEMPEALEAMIGGSSGASPIAPVDLAQAAIGPGMAIFSKYEAVLNQDGSKMSVHDALILINRAITDYLNPDSGNFDNDTLFCDDWFSQYGWSTGPFGDANTLAQAKGTSVDGVREAGVIESGGGKVRLLKWSEYPTDWDPKTDTRTPVWEACHHMIRVLNQQGEGEAGALLALMPERGEHIRQLAYHLYTLCERKKWAEEARAYNELIGSWHAIVAASSELGEHHYGQTQKLDF
jgi:putative DNA methylase